MTKRSKALILLLPVFMVSLQALLAQEIPPGEVLIDGAVEGWSWNPENDVADRAIVPVADAPEGASLEEAFRFELLQDGSNFWFPEMRQIVQRSVAEGDVALVRLWIRSIESSDESGESFTTIYVQRASSPWDKYLVREVSAGTEWREYVLPFEIGNAHGAGEWSVNVGLGNVMSTFEIGGIELIYYGTQYTVDELPRTSASYAGREPEAAWRTAAAQRIEEFRKGDFSLTVVGPDGLRMEGATVRAVLKRHDFEFGSAVVPWRFTREDSDNLVYQQKVAELFSAVGTENGLKWPPWDNEWGGNINRESTLAGLVELAQLGIPIRGHVLVWPGESNLPNSVTNLIGTADEDQIPQMVLDHIEEIVVATRPYLSEWDVLNEPWNNNTLMTMFGEDIQIDWFQEARRHHPDAGLYMNEFGIIVGGGRNEEKQDDTYERLEYLIAHDAPITGFGFQGHFSETLTPPARAYEILDRFAQLGLDLRVTEFDVDSTDRDLQADYTRDFLTICFSHPAVVGFQFWGFWEGAHWRPESALYDLEWNIRPMGEAYRDLVLEEWTTDAEVITDGQGEAHFRGFYGTYDVEIEVGGFIIRRRVSLTPEHPRALADFSMGLRIAPDASGEAVLTWDSLDGMLHTVEESDDLREWSAPGDPVPGNGDPISEPITPGSGSGFYRIRSEAPADE